MKNKKISLTLFSLGLLWLFGWQVALAGGIDFKPNIKIPDSPFNAPVIEITNSSLGEYIAALYSYGSIFAGFVAMFMLVYAGWQWLMAAGRLDKIAQAKNTISSVLIGLGLLFGSYLLMSQISERLVNFRALNIQSIEVLPGMDQTCQRALATSTGSCGQTRDVPTENYGNMICVFTGCPDSSNFSCIDVNSGAPCPSVVNSFDRKPPKCDCVSTDCSLLKLTSCGGDQGYKSFDMCKKNTCLNKPVSGGSTFTKICGVSDGKCKELKDVSCVNSSPCDWDNSGTWCCENSRSTDYCRVDINAPIKPPGEPTAALCR